MSAASSNASVSVRDIRSRKGGEPIVAVTAYDALFGKLADEGGADLILVGDSVGNVFAGHDSTLPVTLDNMIYHAQAVCRGVKRALVVVDMPFLACQTSPENAIINCGRVMSESGARAVKIEGGNERIVETIARVVEVGIPVVAHIGFTPQSVHTLGGFRVQGRDDPGADRLIEEARRLDAAGVSAIVIELVPAAVAERITSAVAAPTIGIGAGSACDGQVLVLPDLLGLNDTFSPRFLKRYANLAETVRGAIHEYGEDVRARRYPGEEHNF